MIQETDTSLQCKDETNVTFFFDDKIICDKQKIGLQPLRDNSTKTKHTIKSLRFQRNKEVVVLDSSTDIIGLVCCLSVTK